MSHTSQVPEPAASYFASRSVSEHPIIAYAFNPERGWHRHPIRWRVSGRAIRRLRERGYTDVALEAGGHTVNFSLKEFR
jgi:hypothetical protein